MAKMVPNVVITHLVIVIQYFFVNCSKNYPRLCNLVVIIDLPLINNKFVKNKLVRSMLLFLSPEKQGSTAAA